MKRNGKILFFASVVLLGAGPALHAAFSSKSAGTSGAAFLKVGAGARPTAMGGAYAAVSDDVNAIYWNPAGLSALRGKNEFVAMRAEMFEDVKYNFFAFAHPMGAYGTVAIGLSNMNIGDIEKRTADTDAADSTFSSNDSAYTLAYGNDLNDNLHLGLAAKVVRQTLSDTSANAFAADFGALYKFSDSPLSLGLAVQNIGSKQKFRNDSDPLPLTIKAGTAYRIGENWGMSGVSTEDRKAGILMALDLHAPRDNDPSGRAGFEFVHGWSENAASAVRAGYDTGRKRQIEGMGSGVAAGAGITYKFFTFDFAWEPNGSLGNTFRYSVKLRF
ncbi:MAG: hypothetical protein A2901_01650 [Elusimicrobia bacterium RIFCSPLOWO2_01_FULL_54_10]|nr:MAG: hypothetical protein A2901_01650 [Elusimicrobia bacterium RIFCSPLOWO2_01_FULL_54_10]